MSGTAVGSVVGVEDIVGIATTTEVDLGSAAEATGTSVGVDVFSGSGVGSDGGVGAT